MSLKPPDPAPTSLKPYCHCPPSTPQGTVLLFYRYYAAPPLLSTPPNPKTLQSFHTALATPLALSGKLRLANEGFNITIAGPTASINEYIRACNSHSSFAGLSLHTPAGQNAFFKPTPGCSCIFPNLSIRICDEITPMAVTDYTPKDWGIVTELEPKEWHDLLTCTPPDEITLLDVRNHYESSLGHFVSASGRPATRPAIRRFSQFPVYIRKRGIARLSASPSPANGTDEPPPEKEKKPHKVVSYCTGGIRCEKASRFMAETLALSPSTADFQICTLRGGIAAYLTWIDAEIRSGRLTAADSAFKGRNYVFDARGSIGLAEGGEEIVGRCVRCGELGDQMRKCGSRGCRLEVVVCAGCEREEVVCCADCRDIETGSDSRGRNGARGMCRCERDREARLWGEDGGQMAERRQGWKQKKRREEIMVGEKKGKADIQVRLIRPERGLIQ